VLVETGLSALRTYALLTMAEHFLNGEDIRGLFLLVDDSHQNVLPVLLIYAEKLKQKGYRIECVNPGRPDVLPSVGITEPFWPPNVSITQPNTVLMLHSIEILQMLAHVDNRTVLKQLGIWLSSPNVSQVVLSLNRNVSPVEDIRWFEVMCSQRMDLLERNGNRFRVETLWRKPRGKAVVLKELLTIENGQLVECSVIKDEIVPKKPTAQPTNILADLTFNVNISGEEQKDKDNLVLPYTEVGQIVYTLDREDDFDEEDDPDDDLEI